MRMNDVNQFVVGFQELAQENMDEAVAKRDELLRLLLKRDKFYVAAQSEGNMPLPDIAPIQDSPLRYMRVFTHQELAGDCVKINTIELCRLARHWFCRGVSGMIINDGAAWFMTPLSDVLSLFLEMVGGKPLDKAEVELIDLYNTLRLGNPLNILHRSGKFGYDMEGEPALPEHIANASGEITLPSGLKVSGEQAQQTAAYLSTLSQTAEAYDVADFTLIPVAREEEQPEQGAKPSLTSRIKAKLSDLKSKIPAKKPKEPKEPKGGIGKFLRPQWLAGAACILFFLLLMALVLFGGSSLSKLKKALNASDYQTVQTLYFARPEKGQAKANQLLSEHIKGLVKQYADDGISEAELTVHLSALQAFPAVADDVQTASQTAIQLSASKKAYAEGEASESASGKLEAWRDVIEADAGSWEKVQKDVTKGEAAYVGEVCDEARTYADCGLYGHAYKLADTLTHWYPWNIKAKALSQELSAYSQHDDIKLPIEVSGVKTSIPSLSNDVDLFIAWKNCSAKTIKEISFFVTPYNEFGSVAGTTFKAIDTKGYKPGEGPESSTWGWGSAWHGASIKSAEISSISVVFEDGISRDFSMDEH